MKIILAVIASLFMTPSGQAAKTMDRQEVYCLTKVVYHESRGEPMLGQAAVAHVVLNRTKSKRYNSNICKVIHQKKQFSHIEKADPDESSPEWKKAAEIAVLSMSGHVKDPTNGALFFYAHDLVPKPSWAYNMKVTVKIGGHTFLRKIL